MDSPATSRRRFRCWSPVISSIAALVRTEVLNDMPTVASSCGMDVFLQEADAAAIRVKSMNAVFLSIAGNKDYTTGLVHPLPLPPNLLQTER